MEVSVVVPTYRRPVLLARCLEALLRQRYDPRQFEIIIADDAAEEATQRTVEAVAENARCAVRYVAVSGRHGPAAARNMGWRVARGEIIAFTDDDCLPDSGWLSAGVGAFAIPEVVAVTGQTIVPLPPAPTDYERNTAGLESSEFITANCFCRRSVLKALGGFDESFTTAWREDSDMHFRLLDTGGRIVREPAAIVLHPVRPAPWGVCLREQKKVMFDALLYRKHPTRFRERIYPRCPARYYLVAATALASGLFAMAGHFSLALALLTVWIALTVDFARRRLRKISRSMPHLAEMLVTSAVIPFLSIFWRLYGALRFRTLFW